MLIGGICRNHKEFISGCSYVSDYRFSLQFLVDFIICKMRGGGIDGGVF